MKIITAPHPRLRQVAEPVSTVDAKLVSVVQALTKTLGATTDPKGVGLAAPQVDKKWRLFVTQFDQEELALTSWSQDAHRRSEQHFINPVITKHSSTQELGPNEDEYLLEGCLSIPKIYGPAPRWSWIEVEYAVIHEGELLQQRLRLEKFPARVFQHELDHLNGVLFTDYLLEYDLPAYTDSLDSQTTVKLRDRSILETF